MPLRGVLHQVFGNWVQHAIKDWTQSDLKYCINEGSKRSKIDEKGSQLDQKWTQLDIKFCKNGGSNRSQINKKGSQLDRKWTQSDLKFCKNEGSKRSKINEKGNQLDRKSRRKFYTKCLLNNTFW